MISSGKTRCTRLVIPDVANSFVIPSDVAYVVLKNVGANPVRFNFDTDAASDYFTLAVNAQSPELFISGGKTFNTDGVGGSSTLEIITWG